MVGAFQRYLKSSLNKSDRVKILSWDHRITFSTYSSVTGESPRIFLAFRTKFGISLSILDLSRFLLSVLSDSGSTLAGCLETCPRENLSASSPNEYTLSLSLSANPPPAIVA